MNEQEYEQHRKRKLTNIMLFVGVLAMAYVAIEDYQKRTQSSLNTILPAMDQAQLQHVTIQRPTHPDITFQHRQGQWFITHPIEVHALPSRIKSLLALAKTDVGEKYAIQPNDYATYGLEPPHATLMLGEDTLHFGDKEPNTDRRYLRYQQQLSLVPERFLSLINGGINAFADPQIVPASFTIQQIRFDDGHIPEDSAIARWQQLPAAGVASLTQPPETTEAIVTLKSADNQALTFFYAKMPDENLFYLRRENANFLYLLSLQQAALLGLSDK